MMKVLAYYLQGGVDIGTDGGLWILHKGSLQDANTVKII
jgi:hypothetical protein